MKNNILIREFTEHTDIYICGCDFSGITETLAFTDDEYTIDLHYNNSVEDSKFLTTAGYLFIFTTSELLDVRNYMDDPFGDIAFIEGFKGKINLKIDSMDGLADFIDDFTFDKYVEDQIIDSEQFSHLTYLELESEQFIWVDTFPAKAIQNLIYNE